jgi:glycine/sarcosine N-methyltransferase
MDHHWILPVPEYYARLNHYILGPFAQNEQEEKQNQEEWAAQLKEIMGEAQGRSVLDCSCGWGTQTIPLARLGWQVTACDISETSLANARKIAGEENLSVDFKVYDMRELASHFDRQFDWAVSCFALYEIPTEAEILQALRGIFKALKPGGKTYFQFRDMDDLMEDQPRHIFNAERRPPKERYIWIQDWDYESEDQIVAVDAFLHEDESLEPSHYRRWTTETIGCRKNVLRKTKIQALLLEAGFNPVTFLPQPEPWMNVRIVASRPL